MAINKRFFSSTALATAAVTIWGLFIANPYVDTFAKSPRIYAPMAQLAPEALWGAFYFTGGLLGWYFLYTNKSQAARLLNSILFISTSVLFFLADATAHPWLLHLVIALFNFIDWRSHKLWIKLSNGS